MESVQKLALHLSRHGSKMTRSRAQVYEALLSADNPLSAVQLIGQLEDMDKVTVYRTIALFERIGIIHRTWNGFKSSIELSEEYSPHHHHFTCTTCAKVLSFRSERIERSLHELESELSVTISRHVVELGGVCSRCSTRQRVTSQTER